MSDTDQDKAVNGGLQDALAVMVVRQGKQEEAEASMRLQLAAKDAQIAALREKVEILEAEIRVMRKLPAALNDALDTAWSKASQ